MDRRLLVMGLSGAGKTTLADALARRFGAAFVDADDLQPPGNRAKMAAGEPLDDADRAPWLDAVAQVIAGWSATGQGRVIACSALRRAYRDRLRAADPGLVTVYLDIEETELRRRLARRRGHFSRQSCWRARSPLWSRRLRRGCGDHVGRSHRRRRGGRGDHATLLVEALG